MTLPAPKPGILDITPYTPGKSSSGGVAEVIKLSSNENPLGPSLKAIEAYEAHIARLGRYPDGSSTRLRQAIADVHGLQADRIVCGAGSDELIQLLVHAYAGVGDEVLFSAHGFLMYKIYAQGFSATPVSAPEKNLRTDVDALLAAVTARTKLVFVANPNNPTGTYISGAEIKRLRDGLPGHVVLVLDNAYAEYVDAADYDDGRSLVDSASNTVILRTFSKIYGLPSLRLGWGYFPTAIADVINRARGPFNVSGVAIETGIAAMHDTAYVQQCVTTNRVERTRLVKTISELGLNVIPSQTNFVLVDFGSSDKAEAANTYLFEHGIIVRDVVAYGLPEYLRITVGTGRENDCLTAALTEWLQPAE